MTDQLGDYTNQKIGSSAFEKLMGAGGRLCPDEWAVGMKLSPEDGVSHKGGGAYGS